MIRASSGGPRGGGPPATVVGSSTRGGAGGAYHAVPTSSDGAGTAFIGESPADAPVPQYRDHDLDPQRANLSSAPLGIDGVNMGSTFRDAAANKHAARDMMPLEIDAASVPDARTIGVSSGGGLRDSSLSSSFVGKHTHTTPLAASTWEIVALTCFNFPYGLICGTMGLFILPAEAVRLYPHTSSMTLGLSLLNIGLSQLICPLAGRVSDVWSATTMIDKRRPLMVRGSIIGAIATLGMWFCSLAKWGVAYYTNLFLGMLALNVVYSVQCGLVPDLVCDTQQGVSSGIVAVHGVVGSAMGFGLMIVTTSWDFHLVYPLYSFMTVATVALSIATGYRLEARVGMLRGAKSTANDVYNAQSARGAAGGHHLPQEGGEVAETFFSDASDEEGATGPDTLAEASRARKRGNRNERKRNTRHGSASLGKRSQGSTSLGGGSSCEEGNPLSSTSSVDGHEAHHQQATTASGGMLMSSQSSSVAAGATPRRMSSSGELGSQAAASKRTKCCAKMGCVKDREGRWRYLNLALGDVLESYTIDTSKGLDFFWVFVGRTFYYIGVSVTAFVMFFLRDVVGTIDQAQRRVQIGCIALIAQFTAASIAYPMGKLSDNPRVGKKLLIYIACVCMSLVYVGYLICPIFGQWAYAVVLGVSTLYGAANGCFLAVDYGLALATLPDKNKAAQALGIWGVSAFIGSAIGPLLWGALIQFFGGDGMTMSNLFSGPTGMDSSPDGAPTEERRFGFLGYEAMLLGGIVATLFAAVMIHFVQLKGPTDDDGEEREADEDDSRGAERAVVLTTDTDEADEEAAGDPRDLSSIVSHGPEPRYSPLEVSVL